ncbi:MAG TPA: alpha/beta hydrolase domain-containing protein [Acidimicrobiia bacterium]|nr:alpha/beta hydrolase domain-containing protein [Acidimicrobiia bacterium]
MLEGSTTPLSEARLAQLYPSRSAYVRRYNAHAAATIKAGLVLPEDRAALLAFAHPSRIAK